MRADDATADAAAARQRAVQSVRARVAPMAGSWLGASACVQIALSCSTREPQDLLEILFNRQVVRAFADAEAVKRAQLRPKEWAALFGAASQATRSAPLEALALQPKFRKTCDRLGVSLRCTVNESTQKQLWQKLWTRAACYVGLHALDCEELVGESIGGIVRADSRRLEDIRAEIEDNGADLLLLSQAIVALGDTAT